MDDDDIGVMERGGGLGLLDEPLPAVGIGRLLSGEDLDRDVRSRWVSSAL